MDAGDHLPSRGLRPVEGKLEEATAGGLGHDLHALHDARNHLVLDGGIQVLGQLADDQKVNLL